MTTALCLRRLGGDARPLSATAWAEPATSGERNLLDTLAGPVLDLGCGPGRLVVALAERGVPALGVDASGHAVELAGENGAPVLQRSVFDRLPGEGRWASILLIDGNIGIGGAPATLLARAATLLAPGGTIVVETERPGTPTTVGLARLEREAEVTDWFPWAWVAADDVDELATRAGLRTDRRQVVEQRWFSFLRHDPEAVR